MNKFRFTLNILAIAAFTLAVASMAQGQATRTWVSGVGDDANPCSRTAPCKTFAGAISKTATNGEIDALDPGGFGAVTITKSITLEGGGTFASILVSVGSNAITINGAGATVALRNISFQGLGSANIGVRILAAGEVHIERCIIRGFSGRGISDERTVASRLYVADTVVRNGASGGIVIIGSGPLRAMIDNTHVDQNSSGITVSGANNTATVRNSSANANASTGMSADTAAHLTITDSQTSFNATGVQSAGVNSTVILARTSVTHNTTNGLGFSGGGIFSFGNNEVTQNTGNNGPFTAGGPTLQ